MSYMPTKIKRKCQELSDIVNIIGCKYSTAYMRLRHGLDHLWTKEDREILNDYFHCDNGLEVLKEIFAKHIEANTTRYEVQRIMREHGYDRGIAIYKTNGKLKITEKDLDKLEDIEPKYYDYLLGLYNEQNFKN